MHDYSHMEQFASCTEGPGRVEAFLSEWWLFLAKKKTPPYLHPSFSLGHNSLSSTSMGTKAWMAHPHIARHTSLACGCLGCVVRSHVSTSTVEAKKHCVSDVSCFLWSTRLHRPTVKMCLTSLPDLPRLFLSLGAAICWGGRQVTDDMQPANPRKTSVRHHMACRCPTDPIIPCRTHRPCLPPFPWRLTYV